MGKDATVLAGEAVDKDREAYEKWALTPYTGPLWNFKDATWDCWKAACAYKSGK